MYISLNFNILINIIFRGPKSSLSNSLSTHNFYKTQISANNSDAAF